MLLGLAIALYGVIALWVGIWLGVRWCEAKKEELECHIRTRTGKDGR